MHMLRLCVAMVVALLVSGCTFSGINKFSEGLQVSQAQGSKITLYSIEPYSINAKDMNQMYGYPVLGSVDLSHSDSERMLEILADGVWKWRWRNSILRSEVACFNPRHIVRIQTQNDMFDYVICFQCEGIEVYRNGIQHSYAGVLAKQREFDNVLVRSNVPLATY